MRLLNKMGKISWYTPSIRLTTGMEAPQIEWRQAYSLVQAGIQTIWPASQEQCPN